MPSCAQASPTLTLKPPYFPNLGFPRAILTSRAISMCLGQRALTEVLVVPFWLPLPLVQGVFDYGSKFFEICPNLIQSWFFHSLLWNQFGSDNDYYFYLPIVSRSFFEWFFIYINSCHVHLDPELE